MKFRIKGFSVILVIAALAFAGVTAVPTYAAEKKEELKFKNSKTKKVKAISQKLAKALEPVREAAEAEQWSTAIGLLQEISTVKLKSHEKAEIYNFYGYLYYATDKVPEAIRYYSKAIAEPDVSDSLEQRTLYTLAQLQLISENYDQAIKLFKQWMGTQEIVGPEVYAMLATAYYSNKDMSSALKNIEISIDMRESKGKVPQENWFSLQRAIYYERNNFKKVVSILEKLIKHYPNVRYWRELSGMHAELNNEKKQLAAYDVANVLKGLDSENQRMGLAYMLLNAEAPWYAAKIIQEGMKARKIEETAKNLQILGSALYQSRELKKALPVMEKAASKSDSGENYARLAGIYADLERYDESIRTAREALRRGDVRRVDLTNMVLGTAYFNKKQYNSAIKAFTAARKDKRSAKAAARWMAYIKNEQKREEALAES